FLPALRRSVEGCGRKIERAAVMALKNKKSDHERRITLEGVLEDDDISERLPHFLVSDRHKIIMHPVLHEGFPRRALALRDLAFVMRELVVQPAPVDIKRFSQVFHRHRGTLDMPSGKAEAPGAGPLHEMAGAGPFP